MLKVYAVRDVKADAYGNLICTQTNGLAIRSFTDACADARSPMAQYPDDYSLYCLGTFDPSSGELVALRVPDLIVTAAAVVGQLTIARSSAKASAEVSS